MRSSGAAGQTELIPPKHQKRGVKALAVALDSHSVHPSANQSAKRLRNNEHWPISPPVAAWAVVMGATYPDLYAAVGLPVGGRSPYRVRGHAWRCGVTRPAVTEAIVFHGDADNIVHPSNAAAMVEAESADECLERAETRHAAIRAHTRTVIRAGAVVVEQWLIHGSGHSGFVTCDQQQETHADELLDGQLAGLVPRN